MRTSYDALLIVSFGGPEGMDEVLPFLERVLRGRRVPRQRMREVARHYKTFRGVSPINAQIRDLISALEKELLAHGPHLPVYWGNRNWHPFLSDAIGQMADDGVERALAFVTSAFSSYSGCRQYREAIEQAREEVGPTAPRVHRLRGFYNHPGFVEPNIANARAALARLPGGRRDAAHLVFTAHSLPLAMADNCDYVAELQETCRLIAEGIPHRRWRLVYQSRSGPPHQPWLEPDVLDVLEQLRRAGGRDVVLLPVGFLSDHMEVLYDLDTEARGLAERLRLNFVRAATVGAHPRFVEMIRLLVLERISDSPHRLFLGDRGPSHDDCPEDCCLPPPERGSGA